jgi:integrase
VMAATAGTDGRTKEYKIDTVAGLTLVVTAAGTATYYCRYQIVEGGRKRFRREKIGRRDRVKLKDARSKALALMGSVAKGEDPVAKERARKGAMSLRQLFEERLRTDDKIRSRTLDDYRRVLEKHVFPSLADHAANEIADEQFARALRLIEKAAPHAAHKAQSALGSTYRWARKKGLAGVKANPVEKLGFIVASKPRDRVLTETELATLWGTFDRADFNTTDQVKRILRLAVLVGQRNSEVCGARQAELRGLDGDSPQWRIPAVRMKRKTGRDQIIPLSHQAAAIFRDALATAGESEFVFPGSTHGRQQNRTQHIARGTVSNAMSRGMKLAKLKNVRVHDQRKQLTTWLAENQYAGSAVLDAILHHAPRGVTDKFYNFSVLEKPVRTALQQWADHVWAITGQGVGARNVVPMKRA